MQKLLIGIISKNKGQLKNNTDKSNKNSEYIIYHY